MHAYIFELSSRKMDESCWATDGDFYDDNAVDYTRRLTGHERDEAVEFLMSGTDFKFVFKKLSRHSMASIPLASVRKQWIEQIQSALDALRNGRGFSSYGLLEAVECPVFADVRFCVPEWSGEASCSPLELLAWLGNLPTGVEIYINSVFDYHF